MKKVSKLLLALLMVAVLTFTFIGCGGEDGEDPEWGLTLIGLEDVDLTSWTTVYLPLQQEIGLDKDIQRIHFHVGAQGGGHVEIQKIFVSNAKGTGNAIPSGAVMVVDFTQSAGDGDGGYLLSGINYTFEGPGLGGTIIMGGDPLGFLELKSTNGYRYGGNFGSYAPSENDSKYYGFVIRSPTGLGDARIGLMAEGGWHFNDSPAGLYGPVLFLIDVLED